MTTPYVDKHIKRLALAREAAELGARNKVVAELSCLPYRDVARLFSRERGKVPRGVPPSSDNWASEAPLLCRIEAAIFCNLFERLRMAGHGSSISMVVAYREFARHYQPMIHERKRIERGQSEDTLTFDRAFHLVANLRLSCPSDRALWLRPDPKYTLVTCPDCGARSVQAETDLHQCPMCRLVQRLKYDPRVRHVMSSVERHRSAFRAVPPPRVFGDLLAFRPGEPFDQLLDQPPRPAGAEHAWPRKCQVLLASSMKVSSLSPMGAAPSTASTTTGSNSHLPVSSS